MASFNSDNTATVRPTKEYNQSLQKLTPHFRRALSFLPENERGLHAIDTPKDRQRLLAQFQGLDRVRHIKDNPLLTAILKKAPTEIKKPIEIAQEKARTIDIQRAMESLPRCKRPQTIPTTDSQVHDLLVLLVKEHRFDVITINQVMTQALKDASLRKDAKQFNELVLKEHTKHLMAKTPGAVPA